MNGSQSGDDVPVSPDASSSMQIGRYAVARELGRGGMGIVYEAADPAIGRRVAIKVINLQFLTGAGEAQLLRERLFREARSAGALSHPGIVVVYDIGEDREMAFIAMEYVDGPSLHQVQQSGRQFQPAEVVEILRQVAAALDYAHQNGVVHRDIKPPNIMLHKGNQVKLADFGIAKITSAPKYTVTGMVMGTPAYMSPEQIEGRDVDGRSDQFSLAVVAYELLTGTVPFQGKTYASMVHSIVYGERPSARGANPLLPLALDAVLGRAMAAMPENRFATCSEFAAALDSALRAPMPEATLPLSTPPPATVQRPTTPYAPPPPSMSQQIAPERAATPPIAAAPPRPPPPEPAPHRLTPLVATVLLLSLAVAGAAVYRFWPSLRSHTDQQTQDTRSSGNIPGKKAADVAAAQSNPQNENPKASDATPPATQTAKPPSTEASSKTASVETEATPGKKKKAAPVGEDPTTQPKEPVHQAVVNVPRPPTVLTLAVKSDQAWTDTGIDLVASDSAAIVAKGTIHIAADRRIELQQPGGFYPNCVRATELFGQPAGPVPAPNLSCWSLIGRVGPRGPIFEVGVQGTAPAGSVGRLYLGVNDDNYADNSGAWSASITVEHH